MHEWGTKHILGMMGFLISWKLILAALIPLPLMAVLWVSWGNHIHGHFMRAQDAFGDMNDRVLEIIAGVRVIRAFVQETATEQRFQDMTNDVYRKNIAVTRIDALFEPIVKVLVTERGRITIDGKDIHEIPKQLLRQQMGIVLQDPFLFVGTIASNVSLDDPAITRDVVEKAIRDVGAKEMFSNLPHRIDELVIEKGATLSAGQRQLISFARALAFNPAILILDEATASIDSETEAIIQSGLDVLKKGRTTFIIAHRLSTIRNADQILVLDRGKIIERGNHDSLMQQSGKYFQMYQLQQGRPTAASKLASDGKQADGKQQNAVGNILPIVG
ncbi:MAG: ATP-binding cassette domain-containing protein [Paenibacillaceae bacterium]